MLYMVIERVRAENVGRVGARFKERGRMLPEGVVYHASWVEKDGGRCFQAMEAPDAGAMGVWIDRWKDLVDFEVVRVLTSAEFWAKRRPE